MPLTFRRPNWSLLVPSFLIAACVVVAVWGVSGAVTGKDAYKLPDVVEQIDPVPAAVQVPAQASVFVDLLPGYTGVLVIDGLELETVNLEDLQDKNNKPGQQITLPPTTIYEPGNCTLTFAPNEGAPIESFTQGQHVVQVLFWKITDGRRTARSYTWTFNVF